MGDESEKQRWLPIESNPEVMNKFLHNCGLPKEQWAVADVFGLDEPLLAMLPQPVLSLMLLFPINDRYIEHCTKQEEALKTSQQVRLMSLNNQSTSSPIFSTSDIHYEMASHMNFIQPSRQTPSAKVQFAHSQNGVLFLFLVFAWLCSFKKSFPCLYSKASIFI